MKSKAERMGEFIEYHKNGDGECNNVVLLAWANQNGLTLQDRYDLAVLFSITYCVESALILFKEQRENGALTEGQLKDIKPRILFQSDRKYMRMKDNFERCYIDYARHHKDVTSLLKSSLRRDKIDLRKAIPYVSRWVMYGRFSAFLFLETFVRLTGAEVENATIEWKNGDTATSGLLNLFGYDQYADAFDATGKLPFKSSDMDRMLAVLQAEARQAKTSDNVTELETSLCAYRKFYKGSRYNGYYLDRMLEEIVQMQKEYPKISEELFEIRRRSFKSEYLGENGGWSGIRKELKTMYKKTGRVT